MLKKASFGMVNGHTIYIYDKDIYIYIFLSLLLKCHVSSTGKYRSYLSLFLCLFFLPIFFFAHNGVPCFFIYSGPDIMNGRPICDSIYNKVSRLEFFVVTRKVHTYFHGLRFFLLLGLRQTLMK